MDRLRHKGSTTLRTERMILRAFTLRDDWAMYENWASDPEVARYMRGKAHSSVAITRQVLESWCCHGRKNPIIGLWCRMVGNSRLVLSAL